MQLKLILRIIVMLSSWLLTLLDNCAWCASEVLAVYCTLAAVYWSNLVLASCWFWSFWTCARAASFSCCSCCNWPRRPWNSGLLGVGPWLCTAALTLRHCGWFCSRMLCITASRLLSVDTAPATERRDRGSNDGSPRCGASYYPSKLKAESGWLSSVSCYGSPMYSYKDE